MNRGDVRVIERRQDARFALEAGSSIWVGCNRARQDFDSDIAPKAGIARAIDLAHAAFANLGRDLIRAEARASSKGHERCGGLYERNGSAERQS
jgi:hypothetical protein